MSLILKQLLLILENVRTPIYSYQPAGHIVIGDLKIFIDSKI